MDVDKSRRDGEKRLARLFNAAQASRRGAVDGCYMYILKPAALSTTRSTPSLALLAPSPSSRWW